MTQDEKKKQVAEAALAYVEDDSIVGVGTGSSDYFFPCQCPTATLDQV